MLHLAVSGRLVEQNRADGEGLAVVEDGVTLVAEAIANGWSRRRTLPDPAPDEIPFPIPDHWVWARLPRVAHGLAQLTPDSDFTYIDVSSVDGATGDLRVTPAVIPPEAAPSRARKAVSRGVVLYSTIRPYLKNVVHLDRDFDPPAIASTAFAVLRPVPGLDPRYLKTCLRSAYFSRFVELRQKGVAYPAINDSDLALGLVPIPPLAEQQRIVAKVDELMGLCDELAARQERQRRDIIRFRRSALHAVTEAESLADLRRAWDRVSYNWPTLAHRSDAVVDIRETIVQLAVEGRLVRQDPHDEPAATLLEDCRKRKAELVKAGGRSRSDLEPLSDDDLPFEIPTGWALARLDLWCEIGGGLAKGRKLAGRPITMLPYLRVANVKAGYLALDEIKHIEVPLERYNQNLWIDHLIEGAAYLPR